MLLKRREGEAGNPQEYHEENKMKIIRRMTCQENQNEVFTHFCDFLTTIAQQDLIKIEILRRSSRDFSLRKILNKEELHLIS